MLSRPLYLVGLKPFHSKTLIKARTQEYWVSIQDMNLGTLPI